MTLSYAVIGTGAIGGYYGGRLAASGCDVHFLLRSDYEHVCANGIAVDSVKGDFVLSDVKAYRHSADMPPVDVVLVCLKTTQNTLLPHLLPPMKDNGVVLLLQNGLGVESSVERTLRERLASVPILFGGLCFICANKIGPGHIRHVDYGRLLIGAHEYDEVGQTGRLEADRLEADRLKAGRLEAIAADFNRAKVPTELTDDLAMARWLKLVWNVPYNGLSVALDATTEEMMADSGIRELILTLMREVVAIANAWGQAHSEQAHSKQAHSEHESRRLSEAVIEQMFNQTETMPSYLTSMKLDLDSQRPLEIDAILGAPLLAADAMNVEVPAMRMLHQQLVFLNARNIAQRNTA